MAATAQAAHPADRPASLILALHARYEQAFEEYNQLDEASRGPSEGDENSRMRRRRYDEGMKDSAQETDLIRLSVLWQVPITFEEATVLAFHLWSLDDAATSLTEAEKKGMEVGMNSLFDFLVCEGCADMNKFGRQFSDGAMLAFQRRRTRTGQVEEA